MAVSAKQVKELRDRTGLGMMDCKRALEEAGGVIEAAIEQLRRKSALKAEKRAGRTAAEGLLGLRVSDDGRCAALVEVNIETDFAARNEKFTAFVGSVLDAVFEHGGDTASVAEAFAGERETLIQEIGENIAVRRVARLDSEDGYIAGYLHNDRRKAAVVELSGAASALARDLAMHVTAHDPTPLVVKAADLDAAVVDKERDIYRAQADAEAEADAAAGKKPKPPEILAKMVDGRVRKFLGEVSLVDQKFVKDASVKVGKLLGGNGVECRRFLRFEVGEGIAVEREDFAAEVAAQVEETAKSA
ncbi:MAG: translation elongation factor Ts [Gammaproteobacteria bacterium]|nr:translation elongation factor Ts [Gammaproteobacteria bacterium]